MLGTFGTNSGALGGTHRSSRVSSFNWVCPFKPQRIIFGTGRGCFIKQFFIAVTLVATISTFPNQAGASHSFYAEVDSCLNNESKYFGTCPLPFDASNPQQVIRHLGGLGILCADPFSYGNDRLGGRYVKCNLYGTPVVIRSYPNSRAYRQARLGSIGASWTAKEFKRISFDGCVAVELEAFRYRIELWAKEAPLTRDRHGELAKSIQQALSIPSRFMYEKKTGQVAGTLSLWKGNLGRNERGCEVLP